jgi:hypothetical protein
LGYLSLIRFWITERISKEHRPTLTHKG